MELGAAAGLQPLGPELESFHAALREAEPAAAAGRSPAAEGPGLGALAVLAGSPLLEWARRPSEGEGAEGGRTAALLALLEDLQQDAAAAEQQEQPASDGGEPAGGAEGDAGLPAGSPAPLGVAVVASGPRAAAALCARLRATCSGQVSLLAEASSGSDPPAEAGSSPLAVVVFTAAEVVSPAAAGALARCQHLIW